MAAGTKASLYFPIFQLIPIPTLYSPSPSLSLSSKKPRYFSPYAWEEEGCIDFAITRSGLGVAQSRWGFVVVVTVVPHLVVLRCSRELVLFIQLFTIPPYRIIQATVTALFCK